jgi:hypothetical protein
VKCGSVARLSLEQRAESRNASELRSLLRSARRSSSSSWGRRSAPLSYAAPPPSRATHAASAAAFLRSMIRNAALALWLSNHAAIAADRVIAHRVADGSIALDGVATESAWSGAQWYEDFVQRDPNEGALPSQRTRAAVVFDSRAIYVFVRASDNQADQIVAALTRRDRPSSSDWIEVWLAPQPDRRSGYRFAVNARGVLMDARLGEGGETQDFDWNGVWSAEVSRDETGWNAEFEIPFSELRVDPSATWGINISRRIQRLNEESVLRSTPKMSPRVLGHVAELRGVEGIATGVPVSVIPYALVGWQRQGPDGSLEYRVGGDLRVGLGAASTLEATVLPDFGQVESDPSQLNLTAFEIFLPERRPFFLEGRDTFRFPLALRNWSNETLYYSRRIGQQPGRDLGLDDTASVDYPTSSRIIGAGKWLGRTPAGLNYGLLTAVTETERATVRQNGATSRPLVAPPTSYTVARARRDFDGGRSAVGVMATHVERVVEGDERRYFVNRATALATDFDWRHRNIGLTGHLLGTRLEGSSESINSVQTSSTHYMQRPDAYHLHYDPSRTTLGGWGAEIAGGKFDGTPVRAGVFMRARSPGLNPNDLGYMQRADSQVGEAWLDWHLDRPTPIYRSLSFGTSAWGSKTFGPELTGTGLSLWSSTRLRSNMIVWLWTMRTWQALDVSLLRGGAAFLVPGGWMGTWGFQSDDRQKTDCNLTGSWNWRDQQSLKRVGAVFTLRTRPASALSVSLAPSYERSVDDLQYVNGDDPNHIVLGRLLRTTGSITLRVNWALTPDLSLETYAMPYISAGTYARFYGVAAPRASDYSARLAPTSYAGDARFVAGQVRSNLVMRWDYTAGSSLYVVWTHEQTTDRSDLGRFSPFIDSYDLLRAKSYDTVMLKLTYLERF